jgi:hypothetical protein
MDSDLVLFGHRLADSAHEVLVREFPEKGAFDLLDNYQSLSIVLVADRKRDAAIATQRRMAALYGVLDILRVMVHAADDDHVLNTAGDVEFAVRIEKAEVAGSQPRRV